MPDHEVEFNSSLERLVSDKLGLSGTDSKIQFSIEDGKMALTIECLSPAVAKFFRDKIETVCTSLHGLGLSSWLIIKSAGKTIKYPIEEVALNPLSDESEPMNQINLNLEPLVKSAQALNLSLFVVDYDGVFLLYQPRPGAVPIVPVEQMIGNQALEYLPPGLRELFQRKFDQAIEAGQSVTVPYTNNNVRGGYWNSCEATIVPFPESRMAAIYVRELERRALRSQSYRSAQ